MIEQTPNAPPAEATVQKTVEDCQRYRDKLYWRCRLYFRDWPDYAEDCVQEAYIELMQALRAGRCIHNYEAWLFKVAILKGQVMIREEKMRRESELQALQAQINPPSCRYSSFQTKRHRSSYLL